MLKRLLPKIKEKLKKPLPLQRSPEEVPQERRNLSPNLLLPLDTKNLFVKHSPAIVRTTNYVVIFVSGLFLILLFVNFMVDRRLRELTELRDSLVQRIEDNASVEVRAREINRLIDVYKAKSQRVEPVSDDLEEILAAVQGSARLLNLRYDGLKKTYDFNATTRVASNYAFMISDLLEIESVESIAIKSVSLVSKRGEYSASLEVNLK